MNMSWRKSSYSTSNGGECIEVGVWRKSSDGISATVAVRDTRDNGAGPVLRFAPGARAAFTTRLR